MREAAFPPGSHKLKLPVPSPGVFVSSLGLKISRRLATPLAPQLSSSLLISVVGAAIVTTPPIALTRSDGLSVEPRTLVIRIGVVVVGVVGDIGVGSIVAPAAPVIGIPTVVVSIMTAAVVASTSVVPATAIVASASVVSATTEISTAAAMVTAARVVPASTVVCTAAARKVSPTTHVASADDVGTA
jgi:hypothetical protein